MLHRSCSKNGRRRLTRDKPVIGNESWVLDQSKGPFPEGHTKGWKVYVRGIPNGPDITTWLKKVQFKLHHTYADSSRSKYPKLSSRSSLSHASLDLNDGSAASTSTSSAQAEASRPQFERVNHNGEPTVAIEAPGPFELTETGYGEFNVEMRLYFPPESGEKAVYREHYLQLSAYGTDEQKVAMEKANKFVAEKLDIIEFNEPSQEFFKTLTSEEQFNWLKVKKGRGKGKKPDFVFEGDTEPTAQLPETAKTELGMGMGGLWSNQMEKQILEILKGSASQLDEAIKEEERKAEERGKRMQEISA